MDSLSNLLYKCYKMVLMTIAMVNIQLFLMLAYVVLCLLLLGRFVKGPFSFDSPVFRTTQSRGVGRTWYAWLALLSA